MSGHGTSSTCCGAGAALNVWLLSLQRTNETVLVLKNETAWTLRAKVKISNAGESYVCPILLKLFLLLRDKINFLAKFSLFSYRLFSETCRKERFRTGWKKDSRTDLIQDSSDSG